MRVIAKAYGSEPLERELVDTLNGRHYLVNPSLIGAVVGVESTAVGFRPETVFEYESGLYTRLRQAFDAGDAEMLDRLWSAACRLRLSADASTAPTVDEPSSANGSERASEV